MTSDHATEHLADDREAIELEDRLWWWAGRRRIIRTFLRDAARARPIGRTLEIGCGSGGNLGVLAELAPVIAVERSAVLARRARARGVAEAVYHADFTDVSIAESFDLTCMFDVLEHVQDDAGLLRHLNGLVEMDHQLLVSVPANPSLYGPHDRLLQHYRRYTGAGLRSLLEQAGFSVVRASHFMSLLFPVVAAARTKDIILDRFGKPRTEVTVGTVPPLLNAVLRMTLHAEATLSRLGSFPFGVWYFALARKDRVV